MLITLKMLMDKPRPLHVIPTRRTGWQALPLTSLLAATAVGAALLAAALSGHGAAQAGKPASAFPTAFVASAVGAAVGATGGAMDHSMLNNPDLLPEPNAALLHSDPNGYVPLRSTTSIVH